MERVIRISAVTALLCALEVVVAAPALATDVSMSPTPYDNPYAVETNKPPYAYVYFYDVDHVETYTLFIGRKEYARIPITEDLIGRSQYTYRFRPP